MIEVYDFATMGVDTGHRMKRIVALDNPQFKLVDPAPNLTLVRLWYLRFGMFCLDVQGAQVGPTSFSTDGLEHPVGEFNGCLIAMKSRLGLRRTARLRSPGTRQGPATKPTVGDFTFAGTPQYNG